jgi:hypothetical protein
MKYIMPKGYIAVDGTSLTVGEVRMRAVCGFSQRSPGRPQALMLLPRGFGFFS